MKRFRTLPYLFLILVVGLTGCAQIEKPPGPTTQPQLTPPETRKLSLSVLYPSESTEIEMGKSLKSIVKVTDAQGHVVGDAQVTSSIKDSNGKVISEVPLTFGAGDVYRSDALPIPHKMQDGLWTLDLKARTSGGGSGETAQQFHVLDSTSEILLKKYGFWINSPAFGAMVPTLTKEQGDAQNGMIVWGGIIPAQHIFPESHIQVHWRQGQVNLQTAEDVRSFMLGQLGDLGYSPVRDIGPFERTQFKTWPAWKVKTRGQFLRYDWQWYVFYAPEVDKTYALGTLTVLFPAGKDPHEALSESFEVHPELKAAGAAPEPLPDLIPPPEALAPEIGARFHGTDNPIILTWKPVRELAKDEYYQVSIDYNYSETNTTVTYATREPQFTMPASLYGRPNCGIFNWEVTMMRQTGQTADGQPEGVPISFSSLYRYVEWRYPMGVEAPFKPLCPNPQV